SALERLSPYGSPRMPIPDQVMGEGAAKVYQMLAMGNTALFLDIWTKHKFYEAFGLARFNRCLPLRKTLRGSVYWPLIQMAFGEEQKAVVDAFTAIDGGNTKLGVEL